MESENVISNAPANYNLDPRGLGCIYYDCMLKYSDKVAQINGLTGEKITFRKVLKNATRIAVTLQNEGVKPGDVIAMSICNNVHCPSIIAAGFFIGSVVMGIDENLPPESMSVLLNQVKPKVIFAVDEVVDSLVTSIESINLNTRVVLVDSSNEQCRLFDSYLKNFVDEETFEPFCVNSLLDTAMVYFTSGTTGFPKGVFRSHLSLLTTYYNIMNCGFCWDVIMENTTPAWTVYMNYLTISILCGTTRVVYKYLLPEYYWDFTRYQVTFAFLTVFEAMTLSETEKPKGTDLQHLKTIILGGSILTPNKLNKIKQGFPNVEICNAYGLTETGVITLFKLRDDYCLTTRCNRDLSVGRGFSGVNFKVVDLDHAKSLGPNKNGEVRIKITHSLGNRISADTYDEDGWFKSGDVGYYDEDRRLFIVDRVKEIFKYQYHPIIPSIIEDVIFKHSAVENVMVTGVAHDVDIERPIAVITLKHTHKDVSGDDIQNFVTEHLPDHYRLRGGIRIIDKFPITHSGKIRRQVVRGWLADGKI